jgi:O-antigen/teichoic acid export membrane protein
MTSKIRRSVVFSLFEKNGSAVLGLIGTLILVRLLTPSDFGIYSVSFSVVMIIDVIRDFGVGTYLVQERQLTKSVVQTVFTVSLALSLACAGAILAITIPAAALYGEPRIVHVIALLSLTFLLGPFGTPSTSLLRRDLDFGKLAAIGLLTAAVNLVSTVALAWLGFGYMSLAWAKVISSLVAVIVAVRYRPVWWAFRPNLAGWRQVAKFGSYVSATMIINVIHDALPQLIVGGLLGFSAVGLLGRAASICQIPDRIFTSALQPVLLPSLAEQARRAGDLKRAYLQYIAYTSALQWPVLLCLAALATPVVHLLLGGGWDQTASLVRILALALMTLFPASMTFPMFVAVGAVRDTLLSSLLSIPPSLLLTYLASLHSLEAVAATQLVTGPLQVYVAVSFLQRHLAMSWAEFFRPILRSGVVALYAAAPAGLAVILSDFRFDLSLPATAAACIGGLAGWLAGLRITRHPLWSELRRVARLRGWHDLSPASPPA